MTNYFENAKTTEEVKAIYKELVKKFHPDVYGEKGNDILKEVHNQLEKVIKKLDNKTYNAVYNESADINDADIRAKKEAIVKEYYAKFGGMTYLFLFYAYYTNGLRPYRHTNPLTKHNFSGWNVWQLEVKMIIAGYTSTKWSTFAQYKAAKNPINKGEHGTYITLAIVSKSKKQEENEEEEEKEQVFYKFYAVFNEEQTKENKKDNVKMIETTKEEKEEAAQKTLNLWANKYEVVA